MVGHFYCLRLDLMRENLRSAPWSEEHLNGFDIYRLPKVMRLARNLEMAFALLEVEVVGS